MENEASAVAHGSLGARILAQSNQSTMQRRATTAPFSPKAPGLQPVPAASNVGVRDHHARAWVAVGRPGRPHIVQPNAREKKRKGDAKRMAAWKPVLPLRPCFGCGMAGAKLPQMEGKLGECGMTKKTNLNGKRFDFAGEVDSNPSQDPNPSKATHGHFTCLPHTSSRNPPVSHAEGRPEHIATRSHMIMRRPSDGHRAHFAKFSSTPPPDSFPAWEPESLPGTAFQGKSMDS